MTVEYYKKPVWLDDWFNEIKNGIAELEKDKEHLIEKHTVLKEKQKLINFTLEKEILEDTKQTLKRNLSSLRKEELTIATELNIKLSALENFQDVLKQLETASKEMYI